MARLLSLGLVCILEECITIVELKPVMHVCVIGASLSEPHLVCPAEVLSISYTVRSPRLTRRPMLDIM